MQPDPFDVLNLPGTFDLSREAIERAYLTASRRLHPDLAGSDPDIQASAQARTAALNDAATTLRDPERRANALLHRLGGPSKEGDKSLPPGFLQDILEVRMEIEEARGDPIATEKWEQWARSERQEQARLCSTLFTEVATATDPMPRAQSLAAIRLQLNAWRYIERLIEQLDPGDPGRPKAPT